MATLYRRLHGIFSKKSLPPATAMATASKTPKSKAKVAATSKDRLKTTEFTTTPFAPSADPNISKEQKVEALVQKFKKSSYNCRFRGHRRYYAATVRRLASAHQFSAIHDILEHQKNFDDITREPFVTRLISLYGQAGMFEEAQKLFDEMPELKCDRTVLSFNALLAACANSKHFDRVNEIFNEIPEKLGTEPNVISYNIVINAFCETGSFDTALLLVENMEKNGVNPDLVTFNTMFEALYKNNRFAVAEKLWDLMERKDLQPNIRSYNSKLRGLVRENRFLEAGELFEEMGRKGVEPDVFSYNALIKGHVDAGNLEECKQWYRKMKEKESNPDSVTFRMLIVGCLDTDPDFALELCKEAASSKIYVQRSTMQKMVDKLVMQSKNEAARQLLMLAKSDFRYDLSMPTGE